MTLNVKMKVCSIRFFRLKLILNLGLKHELNGLKRHMKTVSEDNDGLKATVTRLNQKLTSMESEFERCSDQRVSSGQSGPKLLV